MFITWVRKLNGTAADSD